MAEEVEPTYQSNSPYVNVWICQRCQKFTDASSKEGINRLRLYNIRIFMEGEDFLRARVKTYLISNGKLHGSNHAIAHER